MISTLTRTPDRAIIQFYELYRGPLLCYIYYRIRDFDDAEDMVQDVFVRLLTYELKLFCKLPLFSMFLPSSPLSPFSIKAFIHRRCRVKPWSARSLCTIKAVLTSHEHACY